MGIAVQQGSFIRSHLKKSKKSSTCPQSATKRTSSFKKKSQRRQRLRSLRPLRRLQRKPKKRQKNKVFMCTKSRISKSPKHHGIHIISTTTNLIHLRTPKAAQIHSIQKIYIQHRSNMCRYYYV